MIYFNEIEKWTFKDSWPKTIAFGDFSGNDNTRIVFKYSDKHKELLEVT